jgi:sec-independent protein translocase protein TatB
MSFLGIGPLELIAILVIALLILGPKDIAKMSKTIGRWLRTIVQSETWRIIRGAANEIRNIPNRLMRESGLEQANLPTEKEISQMVGLDEVNEKIKSINSDLSDWTSQPKVIVPPEKLTPKQPAVNPTPPKPSPHTHESPPDTDWVTPRPRKKTTKTPVNPEASAEVEPSSDSPTYPPSNLPEEKAENL